MEQRFAVSPVETRNMGTQELRDHFLLQGLMKKNEIKMVYTHYDRMIVGGVVPASKKISLPNDPELRASFFLERREMGIINIGGDGVITAGGKDYPLKKLSCLYLGKGTKNVFFRSVKSTKPAIFYLLSVPAHHSYPCQLMTKEKAVPVNMGADETSNKRTIYKYIHQQGIVSCQLVMGLTILQPGSVWNSFPPHTHSRRTEAYFYFDLQENHRVFHFLGEPHETRHIVMSNQEAVLSPPWCTHYGCGTANYGFIWGMGGENLTYDDMDPTPLTSIK